MNVQGFIEYVYTTITFHFQTEKGMRNVCSQFCSWEKRHTGKILKIILLGFFLAGIIGEISHSLVSYFKIAQVNY